MFCISLKSIRQWILMLLAGLILAVVCFFTVHIYAKDIPTQAQPYHSAETQEDMMAFLQQFGWTVQKNPVSVQDVLIPVQFGEVYSKYNELQISQGYDLLPYAGKCVKKWVYAITNYPGYARSEVYVRATVLVSGNRIIGGDICSVELDGFMHGFAYQIQ